MSASKTNYLLMVMSAALLVSFFILLAAFKGDSVLRIVLAAGGVAVFGGFCVALLVAGKRTPAA